MQMTFKSSYTGQVDSPVEPKAEILYIWTFLFYWIKYWNINRVIQELENQYKTQTFLIKFFCWRMWIIQTPKEIKKILNSETNELTYINKNFNRSHGHWLTINCFESSDPFWKMLHYGLKNSLDNGQMTKILSRHLTLFISNSNKNLPDALEQFLLRVWSEYCFGPINVEEYVNIRELLLKNLKLTYYNNPLSWIPFIGALSHKILYWWYKEEFTFIDSVIEKFVNSSLTDKNGFFYRLSKNISKDYNVLPHGGSDPFLKTILVDNAFLSVLVYDFIYKVLLDWVLRIKNLELIEDESLERLLNKSLNKAFLYPFRYRTIKKSIDLDSEIHIVPGDGVCFNLKKSQLYFSWGPRSCVGQSLFKQEIFPFFRDLLLKKGLRIGLYPENKDTTESDKISNSSTKLIPKRKQACLARSFSPFVKYRDQYDNIPELILNNNLNSLSLFYPRDWAKKNIPNFKFKGVNYYQILDIYQDPVLFSFIIRELSQDLDNIDGIVTPEVRGISLAGAIAYHLNKPLYIIRKKGKIPGEVYNIKYKTAYSEETIEFSVDWKVANTKLVLVDDGIASGGTTKACIELMNLAQAEITEIRAIINHTYCKAKEERKQFDAEFSHITKTIFDL